MKGWQCKCGKHKGFGTDGPARCAFCETCKTTVETSPELHEIQPRPHEYYTEQVETDGGIKPLSRCKYCHRTKLEIEIICKNRKQKNNEDEMPNAQCPKCGALQEDYDGFGVLYCDSCGYCKHPTQQGDGTCSICGEWVRSIDVENRSISGDE